MNLKLNVVRLANEDVIATSTTLCSHLGADRPDSDRDHIYVTALGMNNTITYYSCGDSLTYEGTGQQGTAYFATSPEVNTWYYYSSSNGGEYVKCEEQTNEAHPTIS